MREFFKSWRRKLGVVTLALACVFMVGWMRSIYWFDDLTISLGTQKRFWITSVLGYLSYDWDDHRAPAVTWRSEGRDTARKYIGPRPIPYWSIVFPLTLLSAYLLLGKPRPEKPTQPIEP